MAADFAERENLLLQRETYCQASEESVATDVRRFIHVEVSENGGASAVHLYTDEFSQLGEGDRDRLVSAFFDEALREEEASEDSEGVSSHVMAIVHGAAKELPELVHYMATFHPKNKCTILGLRSSSRESATLHEFALRVKQSYMFGTYRDGPLDQLSLVGRVSEEAGGYFPELLDQLEAVPFLRAAMPWGRLSCLELASREDSDDGPILWVRPGEQMVPLLSEQLTPLAKRRKVGSHELSGLVHTSRTSRQREMLFEDRTYCHADHVDQGLNRHRTAAVGVLKAVTADGGSAPSSLVVKDVIAFHAGDFEEVAQLLHLDVFEPPVRQCAEWIQLAKLNELRRRGIRYAHIQLCNDDIYFIPRKVVHQFQTVAACTSIAWHLRYAKYYRNGPPQPYLSILNLSASNSPRRFSADQFPGQLKRKASRRGRGRGRGQVAVEEPAQPSPTAVEESKPEEEQRSLAELLPDVFSTDDSSPFEQPGENGTSTRNSSDSALPSPLPSPSPPAQSEEFVDKWHPLRVATSPAGAVAS